MTNQIKNFILEGEKIEEMARTLWRNREYESEIEAEEGLKQFISSRQISLIKMIVEECEGEKFNHKEGTCYGCNCKHYDKSLDTISSKLKELYK